MEPLTEDYCVRGPALRGGAVVWTVFVDLYVEELSFGLGCHGFWSAAEVYLIRRECSQAGVWSGSVVVVDVATDGRSGLADRS